MLINCQPAAFPRAAAFTRAAAMGFGGKPAAMPRKPQPRRAGWQGRSMRAALAAYGYSESRIAAKLAAASAALASGAPLAWPRGFA